MKMNKIFHILFLIILPLNLISEEYSGEIYHIPDIGKKVINLGPCYIGESVFASFKLRNTGTQDLRMLAVSPSIEFYGSPTAITPFEFLRFFTVSPALPFVMNTTNRKDETLLVRYASELDTISAPLGRKESMLKIGLVQVNDTNKVVVSNIFKLIARKTVRFVEGFDEVISFDTVMVGSSQDVSRTFSVRNTQNQPLPIVSTRDTLLSQAGSIKEFIFEQKIFPISLQPKNTTLDWSFNYSPKDMGSDTALFIVNFLPDPSNKPDSTDFCFVKVIGTGGRQELKIEQANANFSSDTIFVGNVSIRTGKLLNIILGNRGNIPFGCKEQYAINTTTGELSSELIITNKFLDKIGHLPPNTSSNVAFEIKPSSRGFFSIKYVIENDISNRNILGVQASDRELAFYIVGRAVEPEISVLMDTINFGSVVYSGDIYGDCPSQKDTLLRILNIGNIDLNINDIILEDNFNFSVSERELIIAGNSEKRIEVSFHSAYPPQEHFAKMFVVSNSTPPLDTLIIYLRAQSTPPILANLSIPDSIKSRPGTMIEIPIVLSHELYNPSIYAKYYDLTLTYNPTLLKYDNRRTLGTASEGASVNISEIKRGSIRIQANANASLLPRDTLIYLTFKTYLGDMISTEIAIFNPMFGSDNCKRVIDTKIQNGSFSLDSVCGLPFKAIPQNFASTIVKSLSPNPASDIITIYFNKEHIALQESIYLELINSFANRVIYQDVNLSDYNLTLDISQLSSGIYFLKIVNSDLIEVIPIVIRK